MIYCLKMVLVFIASLSIFLSIFGLAHEYIEPKGSIYDAVIVDCGSSGSRAKIFTYNYTSERIDCLEGNKCLSYPIDKGMYKMSKHDAIKYIKPLVTFIDNETDNKNSATSSVHLYATAGMRTINISNQARIMRYIQAYMKDELSRDVEFRTIDGQEEGINQWRATKVMSGYYYKKEHGFRLTGTNENLNFDGIIEIGGASLQVTFGVDDLVQDRLKKNINESIVKYLPLFYDEVDEIKYGNLHYKLASVSFLGLGFNSIRQMSIQILLHKEVESEMEAFSMTNQNVDIDIFFANYEKVLEDPCVPNGANFTIQQPKTIYKKDFFAKELFNYSTDKFDVTIKGIGSAKKCRDHLHNVIDRIRDERLICLDDKSCTSELLRTLFVPFNQFKFVVLGNGLYHPMKSINSTGQMNMLDMFDKVDAECNKTWKKPKKDISEIDIQHLYVRCFNLMWGLTFLEYGLRLSPWDASNVYIQNQINGIKPDWAVGAFINLANKRRRERLDEVAKLRGKTKNA